MIKKIKKGYSKIDKIKHLNKISITTRNNQEKYQISEKFHKSLLLLVSCSNLFPIVNLPRFRNHHSHLAFFFLSFGVKF